MEAGGPRSQGLGACLEKEPFLTDLKLERPCCQEVCPKVNSSQRRCLLQNTEPGCEPGNRRVSPGEGALPGSGGLQVLFIPALEAWALNGPPPPRRASPVHPTLTLCILVPAIRVGSPRPQSHTPPARVLPRCPSFPTSGSGPSSAQHHSLCWEGHCADAQGHS